MKKKSCYIVAAAMIAAAYAALTYLSAAFGIAYSGIQFRLSEALCCLTLLTPAAVPGLTVGCLLGNLFSPAGILDMVLGTAATFFCAVAIRCLAKVLPKASVFFTVLFPVIFNSLTVGFEIVLVSDSSTPLSLFLLTAAEVAIGEAAVCSILGIPLYYIIKPRFPKMFR